MKIDVDQLYDDLRQIEERIKKSEGTSVEDRWEFGLALLQRRVGKQLPRGVVASVVKEHGISRSEIYRRMQLAEKFASKDEVSHAWDKQGSWRRIVSTLPKRETASRPAWDERAKARLDKLMNEAGGNDERHAALVALLQAALGTLGTDGLEVAA